MRPVREVTPEEENWRTENLIPGNDRFHVTKRDTVHPEPVGTIVLMAFEVTGYDSDCDGSALARLRHIDKDGNATGWEPNNLGLSPETALVVGGIEWNSMFDPQ